jgi:putative RecB family exonuclease
MNTHVIPLPLQAKQQSHSSGDPLKYISASRLKTFHTCRLQWYFRYIEQIPTITSPALFIGQIVHAVLQAWNMARWRQEDTSIEQMSQVFNASWVEGCQEEDMIWETPDQESGERVKAWNILEHYLTNSPIPLDEKPEAVEVRVERDFMAAGLPPLLGIIDLVRQGGRIVDFKTTARTPTPLQAQHQNEIQMSCYCVLYREATGHQESGVELHHLVKTKQPKLVVTPLSPMTSDQARRLMAQMESYVQGIEAEDFVPSPGQHCSWCDYFKECRAWKGGASNGQKA